MKLMSPFALLAHWRWMPILLLLVLGVYLCFLKGPLGFRLLHLYPKRFGSSIAGWLAQRELPLAWRPIVLGGFARHYGVAVEEAERDIRDYPSLQAFFTRRLKPGLRPQAGPIPGFINSPVDARIIAIGRIERGTVLQAKGLNYGISDLLKHDPNPERFEGGHYLSLYLSPRDYHRIHIPFQGQATSLTRVEGELWPVNDASTSFKPRLYVRNRRVIWTATGTGPCEGLDIAMVSVGATHVGGIEVDERWLAGKTLPEDGRLELPGTECLSGQDWGTFQFGSTVVLLVGGSRRLDWDALKTLGNIKLGERLGAFR